MNSHFFRVLVSSCAVYKNSSTSHADSNVPLSPIPSIPAEKPQPPPEKAKTTPKTTKVPPKQPAKNSSTKTINVDGELLKKRTIWLAGSIDTKSEEKICTKLLVLEMLNPGAPIFIYISSGGGKVTSGFAIYDMIRYIRSPVIIVALGHCSSMATTVLLAGDVRLSLPNNRFMVHSCRASVSKGTPEDVLTSAAELQEKNEKIKEMIKLRSKISDEKCEELFIKDSYFWPEEALEFGIIHGIVEKVEDISPIVNPMLKQYDRLMKKKNVSAAAKAAATKKKVDNKQNQNKEEVL